MFRRLTDIRLAARVLALLVIVVLIAGSAGCLGQRSEAKRPEREARMGDWRAVHLLGYESDADLTALAHELPRLAALGINVIILEVDYNFEFASHPELRHGASPITTGGGRALAQACRELGVRLIPEFQSLGHQSWKEHTFPLLSKYPEFDLTPGAFPDNKGLYCCEWDPTNPAVNEIVFALMDEIIDAFEADALHVGMDEVFLLGSEHSPTTRGRDPGELYAKAVNDIHAHLVGERGVEMLMWGDRLIDGRKYDFGDWEASTNGTAAAVDHIPKDIIVCPWHYEQRFHYPSIPMFLEKGFRVLPASWKNVEAVNSLISYSRKQANPNLLGHLFTTWSRIDQLSTYPPMREGLQRLAD